MTILCYHSVDPDWHSPLAVTPSELDSHCRWLARVGRVAPLENAIARSARGRVAVTFDDGLSGVHEHAFPILVRHRIPATLFVVAGTLVPGGIQPVSWVDTPPPRPLAALTLDQLMEMQAAGIRVESHSYAHRDLTELSEEEIRADLRSSRELLADLLGRPVRFLAYPRGRHDHRVRRAAEWAGYTNAFGLPEAREPFGRYAVPRVGVYPGNGVAVLRLKTAGWYVGMRTSRAYPPLRAVLRGHRSPTSVAG
jgi:peptidoglycan/xylan/chitin deacetylase (PgdA/CDA1 family)